MKKGWFDYGTIKSQELFDKLPKVEKDLLNTFKDYMLISAGKIRTDESVREILRFRYVIGKSLKNIELIDLRHFLKELKQSSFADHTKNKIKSFIHRFLKWGYKDWSERFSEFEDIKINTDAQNKKEITKKTILTNEEIEKLIDAEDILFWKTFLITQYEGALRTKETRELKWEYVDFEDDGFTTLKIPSMKNRNGTIKISPVVVKVAGNFLRELKDQQSKKNIKTSYVFPSPNNPNKPISKSVNMWFKNLCERVLGRSGNNYLLRHSKGTELQEKVRNGDLSKDNAVTFMRHSEKMFDKVYSHMSEEDIKKLIKQQIYDTKELTAQDNSKIKELEKTIAEMNEKMNNMLEFTMDKMGFNPEWAENQEKKINKKMDELKLN